MCGFPCLVSHKTGLRLGPVREHVDTRVCHMMGSSPVYLLEAQRTIDGRKTWILKRSLSIWLSRQVIHLISHTCFRRFPADTGYQSGSWDKFKTWVNTSQRSTVLGCIDEKHVRHQHRDTEWYLVDQQLFDVRSGQQWDFNSEETRRLYNNETLTALIAHVCNAFSGFS